jgi:hypothetical protein
MVDLIDGVLSALDCRNGNGLAAINPINYLHRVTDASRLNARRYHHNGPTVGGGRNDSRWHRRVCRSVPNRYFIVLKTHALLLQPSDSQGATGVPARIASLAWKDRWLPDGEATLSKCEPEFPVTRTRCSTRQRTIARLWCWYLPKDLSDRVNIRYL